MTNVDEYKKPRGRSPSYPGIPLDAAIERAKALYRKAGRHRAPVDVIIDGWGYTTFSGSANVNLAAVKKFGLLADEGSGKQREGWLTELALDIILDPDPHNTEHIKRAALTPPIHREMWEMYGADLPDEPILRSELIRKRGFTENGAGEFISEWRATMAFAKLDSSSDHDDDGDDEQDELKDNRHESNERLDPKRDEPRREDRAGVLTIPVPIVHGAPVIVEFPGRIGEDDWNQFIAVLTAMKPGLIARPEPE